MKEKLEIQVFLKLHEDALVDELKEEFKIQIARRIDYKGFKRIRFDENLDRKMKLSLLDKTGKLNAELRLSFLDDDDLKKTMDDIIQRSLNE